MFRRIAALAAALMALAAMARAQGALCLDAPPVVALTDEQGRELTANGQYETMFSVREGRLFAAGRRGDYRLLDGEGRPLGETTFAMIHDEGQALVFREGTRYGAMDAAGRVLLSPEWTQLTADGHGGWLALDADPLDDTPDELIHLDANGAPRRTGTYVLGGISRLRSERMPYMAANGLYGAVDADGAPVIAPIWRGMGEFEDGFARVSGPEGQGLIDVEGHVIVAPGCRWLDRSGAMIAALTEDGLQALSPDGGEVRFALPGDGLEAALAGDCLWVSCGEWTRLYDAQGKLLDEGGPGRTYAEGAGGQLIATEGAWGETGQWLVNPDGSAVSGRFQQLLPLCEGRYAWLSMDGIEYDSAELGGVQKSWDYRSMRYGLLDGAGNVLLPARYLEIRAVGEGRLLLIAAERAVLADIDGVALREWTAEAATAEGEAPSEAAGA